jgi:hypothetical protein
MSMVNAFALVEKVTREAFRLETRQRYDVPDERPLLKAFLAGQPAPESDSMARHGAVTRSLRAAGKRRYRVHVVDLLLILYLRYELNGYRENIQAGEEIFIADRSWHPDLAALAKDFLLLDGDTDHASVVGYRYNDDELLARDYSEDPADIQICRRHRDLAMAHAIPYAEFLRGVSLA